MIVMPAHFIQRRFRIAFLRILAATLCVVLGPAVARAGGILKIDETVINGDTRPYVIYQSDAKRAASED